MKFYITMLGYAADNNVLLLVHNISYSCLLQPHVQFVSKRPLLFFE